MDFRRFVISTICDFKYYFSNMATFRRLQYAWRSICGFQRIVPRSERKSCCCLRLLNQYCTTSNGHQESLSLNQTTLHTSINNSLNTENNQTKEDLSGRHFNFEEVEILLKQMEDDKPLTEMKNPFEPEARRCILCKYNVEIDYKNVRLLSQFVSPYTGRIYGRQITGLCIPMQKHISRLIKRARVLAFMPYMHKDVSFYEDPKLFDPSKPVKG